jgi:hypothetical protein
MILEYHQFSNRVAEKNKRKLEALFKLVSKLRIKKSRIIILEGKNLLEPTKRTFILRSLGKRDYKILSRL